MRKLLLAAIASSMVSLALVAMPLSANAGERTVTGAAIGAGAGALVLGPVGAVAGGAIGASFMHIPPVDPGGIFIQDAISSRCSGHAISAPVQPSKKFFTASHRASRFSTQNPLYAWRESPSDRGTW
jgi:hypothetical protein